MPQYLVPEADYTDGSWTNELATGTDLYESVNDTYGAPEDVNYIKSASSPSADTVRLKVQSGYRPGSGTARIHLRARWTPTSSTSTAFVWDTVVGADEYRLQTSLDQVLWTTQYIGYSLTASIDLDPGTYWWRVGAFASGTPLSYTTALEITVS